MAIAFEHGPPHRMARTRARNPLRGDDCDQREPLQPGLRERERGQAGFAERVAAVAGDDVQQIVHLAAALAEQGHVLACRQFFAELRGFHQPFGRQVFRRHEFIVSTPERAGWERRKAFPVTQPIE
jgi:hypothetical protein